MSGPREYDLDEILAGPEFAGRRRQRGRWIRIGTLLLSLLTALGLLWLALSAPDEVGYPDLAARAGLTGVLAELIDVDGDWIGTVDPAWPSAADPYAAARACGDLARRAGIPAGGVLTLMTPGGIQLAACEVGAVP